MSRSGWKIVRRNRSDIFLPVGIGISSWATGQNPTTSNPPPTKLPGQAGREAPTK